MLSGSRVLTGLDRSRFGRLLENLENDFLQVQKQLSSNCHRGIQFAHQFGNRILTTLCVPLVQ
jgi:hypothetical protein